MRGVPSEERICVGGPPVAELARSTVLCQPRGRDSIASSTSPTGHSVRQQVGIGAWC